MFCAEGEAADASPDAWKAALQIWSALDALNEELAAELGGPLRAGIGLHVGMAVVGMIGTAEHRSLQFLGDTGNLAAKLEEQSKPLDCTMVASRAALARIALPAGAPQSAVVSIAGREIEVALFRTRGELQQLVVAP